MTKEFDANQHDPNHHDRGAARSGDQGLAEDQEFLGLLSALCESRATKEEVSRLECLLRSGPQYVERYVSYMDMHGELHLEKMEASASAMPSALVGDSASADSEIEPWVSTENILSMLEEDAEVEQRKAGELAEIEALAAEKFLAFQREQDRLRRPEPVPATRNTFFATVSSLAAPIRFPCLWWSLRSMIRSTQAGATRAFPPNRALSFPR